VTTLTVDITPLEPLANELRNISRSMTKECAIVVTKTSAWGRKQAAKKVYERVNTTQTVLKKMFIVKRVKPTEHIVRVRVSKLRTGISLKHFRPIQTKKKGVTVNSYSRGGGRISFPSAFTFNGGKQVYSRVGKSRWPVKELRYPQTARTYEQMGMQKILASEMLKRMEYEFKKRIDFHIKKASGQLRGRQPVPAK
jgi:hypothetical protein